MFSHGQLCSLPIDISPAVLTQICQGWKCKTRFSCTGQRGLLLAMALCFRAKLQEILSSEGLNNLPRRKLSCFILVAEVIFIFVGRIYMRGGVHAVKKLCLKRNTAVGQKTERKVQKKCHHIFFTICLFCD